MELKTPPRDIPPPQQSHQPGREHEMVPRPLFIRDDYRGSDRLQGRVAIITGGDSGIGRAVAVHFAREGADLAIVYLEEQRDAEETRALVEAEGRHCLLLRGNVGDSRFCDDVVKRTLAEFGRLDVLVNNAAEQHLQNRLEDISPEQLQRTFTTNIFAYFYMAQAALAYLQSGAVILNTTSVTAYRGSSHLLDYASTKGAIVAFTRSLALALAPRGIRVNAVAPGPIWTPLIPASADAAHVSEFGKDTPLGRAGQPAEVAPAFVFLACADGSYITGQTIHPNGGGFVET
jgi:NAD(P)-dependent dehydrogenase (short-subunit alcohol dehydrogenase family)